MWFEQIIRRETGCVTYMIGSSETGQCVVFDPLWDTTPYLEMARRKNSTIRYVIDSHSHADHVSGARRLATATNSELVLPALADITYEATRVQDQDQLRFGEVTLEFVHMPGHRPELMNLLVIDHSRGDAPWCILTADGLMVGDLARPDLAQSGEMGAAQLFDRTLPRLLSLPDYVEVYPGHVAGST
ncbi:MBL fold metallo-hydrolase [Chloroflexi bacterium TSY]|nr:MBL fold metallo-hydrolase [Chloroflexi bacterium TSY]